MNIVLVVCCCIHIPKDVPKGGCIELDDAEGAFDIFPFVVDPKIQDCICSWSRRCWLAPTPTPLEGATDVNPVTGMLAPVGTGGESERGSVAAKYCGAFGGG